MRKVLILAAIALAALVACQREPALSPEPPTVYDSTWYTPDEFARAANLQRAVMGSIQVPEIAALGLETYVQGQNSLLEQTMKEESGFEKPQWGYRKHLLRYRSVDGAGNPIYLSECIIYPEGKNWEHRVPRIILFSPFTNTMEISSPGKSEEYFLAALASCDALFVCPDGQGFGQSQDRELLFLSPTLQARQSADGLWAALEFIQGQNIGLKKNHELLNLGYSLGGSVALAFHREYECNLTSQTQKRMGALRTICAGGPYDPVRTLNWLREEPKLSYPLSFPLAVYGIRESHPELLGKFAPEQFFSTAFLESGILDMIRSKNYSTFFINGAIASRVGSSYRVLASSELKNGSSAICKATEAAFAKEDILSGWKANRPITLLHGKGDSYVPYFNALNAQESLGSNVTLMVTPSIPGIEDHFTEFAFFLAQVLTNL